MDPKGQGPWELVEDMGQSKFAQINVKVTQNRHNDGSGLP